MPLSSMGVGTRRRIKGVTGNDAVRKRLGTLGFVEGVEVEIVNTWANRVIGDLNLPENERKIWMIHNGWSKDSPVPGSGLVGPVVLETVTYPAVK